jgi:predicted DNA repair protein MutK
LRAAKTFEDKSIYTKGGVVLRCCDMMIRDGAVTLKGPDMSGLLALLDDVAALTKLAAVQLDDIATQAAKTGAKVAGAVIDDAAKAGAKAAGVVVDDAAVTPKYVQGLPAVRELPIVLKIARGSLFNKLVILLPAALLLDAFLPWLLTPLLMLGGAYLCFEGAEKILHLLKPHHESGSVPTMLDAAHLEKQRVAGAIKTDFILSAEIMTISLASIESDTIWIAGLVLAIVAVGITVLVYGSVAILVKADDVGLRLAQVGRLRVTRSIGRAIVRGMPAFMAAIAAIGTAAMLWVGGSIIIHGLEAFGIAGPGHWIHGVAVGAGHLLPAAVATIEWVVTAALDGVFGLGVGLLTVPLASYILVPIIGLFAASKPH